MANFQAYSCNLSSLDFSNAPVRGVFYVQSNSALSSITFASSGNGMVTADFDGDGTADLKISGYDTACASSSTTAGAQLTGVNEGTPGTWVAYFNEITGGANTCVDM